MVPLDLYLYDGIVSQQLNFSIEDTEWMHRNTILPVPPGENFNQLCGLDQAHISLINTHEIHYAHKNKNTMLMHKLQVLSYPKFQMAHKIGLQALEKILLSENSSLV